MLSETIFYFLGVYFFEILNTCAAIVTLIFVAFIVVELRENLRLHKRTQYKRAR